MAQNTASMERGRLTIKYSPTWPISDMQAQKLSRSLDLACKYLIASVKQITPICNGSKDVPKTTLEVLEYHFFQNAGVKRAHDEFWRRDVVRIAHGFRRIQCGLQVPIVIKDAYASTVGNAVKDVKAEIRKDMQVHAELGLDWNMSFEEYTGKLNRARSIADAEAMQARGYVAPTKATNQMLKANGLAQKYKSGKLAAPVAAEKLLAAGVSAERVPAWMKNGPKLEVQLAAEQLGSIHINFRRMLRTEDELSDAIVARTIIHEASHKFISTHDFAYAGEDDYERLDRRQGLLNADSYAFAAVCMARDRLLKNDMDMKWADAGF